MEGKPFTFDINCEGVISNRLYIKLRILANTNITIYYTKSAIPPDYVLPNYCRSKGYQ